MPSPDYRFASSPAACSAVRWATRSAHRSSSCHGPRSNVTDGPAGVTEMLASGHFTDDTQMTLFTCEGLIRANVRGRSPRSRARPVDGRPPRTLRWLHAQGQLLESEALDGWLRGRPTAAPTRGTWQHVSVCACQRRDGYGGCAHRTTRRDAEESCTHGARSALFTTSAPPRDVSARMRHRRADARPSAGLAVSRRARSQSSFERWRSTMRR